MPIDDRTDTDKFLLSILEQDRRETDIPEYPL